MIWKIQHKEQINKENIMKKSILILLLALILPTCQTKKPTDSRASYIAAEQEFQEGIQGLMKINDEGHFNDAERHVLANLINTTGSYLRQWGKALLQDHGTVEIEAAVKENLEVISKILIEYN